MSLTPEYPACGEPLFWPATAWKLVTRRIDLVARTTERYYIREVVVGNYIHAGVDGCWYALSHTEIEQARIDLFAEFERHGLPLSPHDFEAQR